MPRLDRFASIHLVHPLLKLRQRRPGSALPILMYHDVCDDPEKDRSAYYKTHTSSAVFVNQMEYLRREGYSAIDLERALPVMRGTAPNQEKRVVITFDDGFRSVLTRAYPVMKQFGFTATVFLPTAYIGDKRRSFKGSECLTWSEVRELHQYGISFGSHTVHHPRLYDLNWNDIKEELRQSKADIEQNLGKPVATFAYPYAFPQADADFVEQFGIQLRDAGYECSVTTQIGCARTGDNLQLLKRLPVNSCDDLALFGAKLEGAYDWLSCVQTSAKWCQRRLRNRRRVVG